MSDGQSETCESIQQQNAMISEQLQRGEIVKWQDDSGQWHVGAVLRGNYMLACEATSLVQTATGIYSVSHDALQPYPPRCEACGGEGELDSGGSREDGSWINVPCLECGGSGRQR